MDRHQLLAAERGTLYKEAETRIALVYPSSTPPTLEAAQWVSYLEGRAVSLSEQTSYTQNQWKHALEAAFLGGMMAAEVHPDTGPHGPASH